MATFNGSERGREESIVRNHPNPKNAGATPNFASGTEAVGKLEKVMTNLNIQIASLSEKMAQVQSTGEGAQGQAQVSMSPLNVNVNHSGRLTAQVEEIQSQISGAVNEAMKQIAPALWRTIKGPATS
jgi:DNA-binding protein YbaB